MLDKKNVDSFLNFMTMYKDRNGQLSSALLEANLEIEEINREIDALQTDMKQHKPKRNEEKIKEMKQEETKQERCIYI